VLDLVEKADDLGALDAVNRAGAQSWVNQPLERGLALFDGAQLVALAFEILLGDFLARIGGRALLPAPFLHRVAALGVFAQLGLRLLACFREGESGLNVRRRLRRCARYWMT